MIIIQDVTKSYLPNGNVVLKKFSLCIKPLEKIGIYAENGTGKSTLMNIVAGCLDFEKGTVSIDGFEIGSPEYRNLLGMVLETPLYILELTIVEMMDFFGGVMGYDKSERNLRRDYLIELLELTNYMDTNIQYLSKGYKARVSIALALYAKPKYLIMDEPFDGLDESMQIKLTKFLSESNFGYIICMHNKKLLKNLCHNIISL